jgi:hypothetical protein
MSRERRSPAMMTDAFGAVFGSGRGGGRSRHDDLPPTPVDRARRLVSWANETGHEDLLKYLKEERKAAEELSLVLTHGQWEPREVTDGDSAVVHGLTAVFHDDELVGLIDTVEGKRRLLVYDERRPIVWSRT